MRFARAFGLAVLLFPVGLATHEVMHLVVYSAFGVPAALMNGTVTFSDGTPNTLDQEAHDIVTFLAWASEPTMDERKRIGFMVMLYLIGLTVLLFFATIEVAYPLLEHVANVKADVLLLPELNYGMVLLILLATTFAAAGPRPFLPSRTGGSSTSATTRPSSSLTTR